MTPIRIQAATLGLMAFACASAGSSGADEQPATETPYLVRVAPLLTKYCVDCHGGEEPTSDIGFDRFEDEATAKADRAVWEKVLDSLEADQMPPDEEELRPIPEEVTVIRHWIETVVLGLDCQGSPNPGRVIARRLNRAEYANTIRDLLGVEVDAAGDFPADDVGYGFDNIGAVLTISPIHMEKYFAAARRISEAAIVDPTEPEKGAEKGNRAGELPESHRRIVFVPASKEVSRRDRSRAILRRFVTRAYRRPAVNRDLDALLTLTDLAERQGESFEKGIRLAVQAVLTSPNFLFRIEQDPESAEPGSVRRLNDYELASRLSYFLWSTMPDERLFELAERKALREHLDDEVARMLEDPKAQALVDNFAGQWLELRSLASITPDVESFPEFDDQLRSAMRRETELFFETMMREDRDIREFLDADFTFVNDRLAHHYEIPDIEGAQFRRVALTGEQRGGILTQASILTITSNPNRTSPVKRGKWILDQILGAPPPPPPPNVPELIETEQAAAELSLRDRLEVHRAKPECAVCHNRMDDLGFGFENYDPIGRWRSHDGEHLIDASGTLPGKKSFDGSQELRGILKNNGKPFARCLTEKMMIYALGRGLEYYDRCAVDKIVDALAKDDYRFSRLVIGIVRSDPFLLRAVEGEKK